MRFTSFTCEALLYSFCKKARRSFCSSWDSFFTFSPNSRKNFSRVPREACGAGSDCCTEGGRYGRSSAARRGDTPHHVAITAYRASKRRQECQGCTIEPSSYMAFVSDAYAWAL